MNLILKHHCLSDLWRSTRRRATQRRATQRRAIQRRGLSQVEVVVGAGLLTVLIGIIPSLNHHLQRVAKETRNYRIAVHELANRLDALTVLDGESLNAALVDLRVAPHVAESLGDPKLQAERINDANGARLVLTMQWTRTGSPPPLQLIGWLPVDTGSDVSQEPDSATQGGSP